MSKTHNIKITQENINNSNTNIFGDWFNNFSNNDKNTLSINPFPYIIVPEFINTEYYNKVKEVFPAKPDEKWWKYENPLEVKYALDNLELMDPTINNIFARAIINKYTSYINNLSTLS